MNHFTIRSIYSLLYLSSLRAWSAALLVLNKKYGIISEARRGLFVSWFIVHYARE